MLHCCRFRLCNPVGVAAAPKWVKERILRSAKEPLEQLYGQTVRVPPIPEDVCEYIILDNEMLKHMHLRNNAPFNSFVKHPQRKFFTVEQGEVDFHKLFKNHQIPVEVLSLGRSMDMYEDADKELLTRLPRLKTGRLQDIEGLKADFFYILQTSKVVPPGFLQFPENLQAVIDVIDLHAFDKICDIVWAGDAGLGQNQGFIVDEHLRCPTLF
eukprot:TRINITY_DN61468_c1_g1_i2.p1 TRINITY_DN61468_c1_g1~~TRINITY_DN61468_c1_g1_i2.p1  ORF type:complete len:212 (+),score=7.78 TRINITY_DN61468_c1_g1_i2:189-824(+)